MQTTYNDDVVINRLSKKPHNAKQNHNNHNSDEIEIKLRKQLKIFSIILFTLSIILFISMISYSPKDEVFTEISISEFFRFLGGDNILRMHYQNVSNWLGLFGALISYFMYNSLFGFISFGIPIVLVLIGVEYFSSLTLSKNLIRRIYLYLIIAFIFSTLMGTLSDLKIFSWLPKEWYGAIGLFVSTIFVNFIGVFGTIIFLTAVSIIVLIFLTDIDFEKLVKSLNIADNQFIKLIISQKNSIMKNLKDNFNTKNVNENDLNIYKQSENNISQTNKEEIIIERSTLKNEDSDPAQIIKRNITLNQFTPKIKNPFEKYHNQEENSDFDSQQSENIDNQEINFNIEEDVKDIEKDINSAETYQIHHLETNIIDKIENFKIDEPDILDEPRKILEIKRQELLKNKINQINNYELNKDDEKSLKSPSLTVIVEGLEDEQEINNPLSTLIHDEKINYTPPALDLLDFNDEKTELNDNELSENAKLLKEKLATFKIDIDNLNVTPGPVVTQYEFVPAPGIKVSRIESLADDIAMALKAKGIRIIAPIPGKGTVGIEIPNKKPSIVHFSSIIKSSRFHQTDHKLPLALGKTIGGEVYVADLAKMPHLLIAGSTGSGKSVGINTIIASLLYKKHPSELKFVIIDPKKVELNQYSLLENHFLASSPDIEDMIITNPEDAVTVLKSVVAEMDNRYDILAQVGQRNITDYNRKVKAGKFKDDTNLVHRPMPYIVVIIDELADLMLTASKEVEAPIIRLAQLARAVGIHLVVATQRPSVDVITGIIKANFPARISYLVASKIDSRTILDQSGAEQLLGNGDMLFLPGGSPKPIRIQNSFISTDEVENICQFIAKQKGYSSPYMLPSLIDKETSKGGISKEERDPLFEEAARLLINLQQASVSILQRRLKIGYARAGKIIDELEDAGVVGPFAGSKPRQVLMESEAELESIL